MKVIFGIDDRGAYKPALQLFARLRFPAPNALLAHFIKPAPAYTAFDMLGVAGLNSAFATAGENVGRDQLLFAKDEACKRDISSKMVLRTGSPTDGLIRLAEETRADIVAVRAETGSLWSPSFLGSISRGLAIGSQSSLLIAKEMGREGAPLKVVLATDHSPKSNQWIEKFLQWRPQGISEIHVVTAYTLDPTDVGILRKHVPGVEGSWDTWVEGHLAERNAEVCERLKKAGYKTSSRVVNANTNDAIRSAMQDTQSDLLVIGAHGHGFVERLFVGSTALHQAVSEPYPVLIVRS